MNQQQPIRFEMPTAAEIDAVIARANQERRELLVGYVKSAAAAIRRSFNRSEAAGTPALR